VGAPPRLSQLIAIGTCHEITEEDRLAIDARSLNLPNAPFPLPHDDAADSDDNSDKRRKFSADAPPRRAPAKKKQVTHLKTVPSIQTAASSRFVWFKSNNTYTCTDMLVAHRRKLRWEQQRSSLSPPQPHALTCSQPPLGERGRTRPLTGVRSDDSRR
jgi:hypothetical protein